LPFTIGSAPQPLSGLPLGEWTAREAGFARKELVACPCVVLNQDGAQVISFRN
jgi:hypothetical protein